MVTERHNRTVQRLQWLVRLRWSVAVGLSLIPTILDFFNCVSLRLLPFYLMSVLIVLYNSVVWQYTRRIRNQRSVIIDSPETVALLNFQIIVDFLFLSASVYFSGGLFSPITFFYLFHIITASVLISPRSGYFYASLALFLSGIIGLLQQYQLVPPVGLASLLTSNSPHALLMLAIYLTSGVTFGLTAYFMNHFFKMSLEEHRAFKELTTLFEIGKTISCSLKLDHILKLVLNNAIKVTGTPAGSVALFDEGSNELVIKAAKGFSEDFVHTHRWRVRAEGMTAKILNRTEPLILDDVSKEPTFNNPVAIREGIKSLMAVPLCFNSKIIGILYVDDFEPRTFSASEVRLVSILATQAAVAINNAQAHERAKWLAITDGLTLVFNHRYFQEQLSKEIRRAERYNRPLSIIMMDIDYFKDYNDSFGHKRGDRVLKIIAELLAQCTRTSDIVARYGGDEFVVILPETQKEEALDLAERVRARIENSALTRGEEFKNGSLTLSLGVASFPQDAQTAGDLIDKVDEVLYLAKAAGRNKACSLDREGDGLYCIPKGVVKPD